MADEENGTAEGELGDAGKKALDAERKARRTAEAALKAARDELAEVKATGDSTKSEVEQLTAKVGEMMQRAETAELNQLRAEVAQTKGLTPGLARRLSGKTREELESDADDLLEAVGKPAAEKPAEGEGGEGGTDNAGTKPVVVGAKPVEDLQSGGTNQGDETVDSAKLAESILKSPW